MKRFLFVVLSCLLLALPLTARASIVREYQTNYGVMTLTFDDSSVNGSYTYQNGRIEGVLDGSTMTGTWRQSNSSGNFVATFRNGFKRIDLKWNYAGETGWKGDWGGDLIRQRGAAGSISTDSSQTRRYSTNYGIMTLRFKGTNVVGDYTYQNGKLKGVLDGTTMTGTWSQNNGSGNFVASFPDDFSRIDLKWNYKGESGWKGDWYGTLQE